MVTDDLKQTIFDWFQYREVSDDEKFGVFISRVISRDYNAYREILRIQPGYARYDWLVTQYFERQINEKNDLLQNGTGKNTLTRSGTDTITDDGSTIRSGNRVEANSGDDIDKMDYGSSNTRSGKVTNTDSFNDYHEISDSKQNLLYGHTITTTPQAKTKQTVEYEDQEGSKDISDSKNAGVAKSAPQSISYPGASAGEIPSLDWSYPSAQNQDNNHTEQSYKKHHLTTTTNELVGTDGNTEKWEADGTGDDAGDVTKNHNDLQKSGMAISTTEYGDGTEGTGIVDKKEGTDTETITHGKTTTTTYNDLKDKNDNTHTTEYGSSDTTDIKNDTRKQSAMINQSQSAGRQGDTGTLLQKATEFIKTSNAWAWLSQRLEVCFQGVYDL